MRRIDNGHSTVLWGAVKPVGDIGASNWDTTLLRGCDTHGGEVGTVLATRVCIRTHAGKGGRIVPDRGGLTCGKRVASRARAIESA